MVTTFPLTAASFSAFFLIAVRCVAALLVAPVFSARTFPVPARVGLAVLLAALLAPTIRQTVASLEDWSFAGLVFQEAMVGLVLGFTAQVVFQAIHMAASLIELQMGLTFAGVVDPTGSNPGSVLSQFYAAFAALVFLAFDGHHMMLLGLNQSLSALPLGDPSVLALSPDRWLVVSGATLRSALQLALPVSGALLLADVALAMLGRAMPQMNILLTSMPAKIAIGLAAMTLAMPVTFSVLGPRARVVAEAAAFVIGGR